MESQFSRRCWSNNKNLSYVCLYVNPFTHTYTLVWILWQCGTVLLLRVGAPSHCYQPTNILNQIASYPKCPHVTLMKMLTTCSFTFLELIKFELACFLPSSTRRHWRPLGYPLEIFATQTICTAISWDIWKPRDVLAFDPFPFTNA